LERLATLDERILAAARSERSAARLATILREEPQMFGMSGVMPKMSFHATDRNRPGTLRSQNAIVKFDSENYTGASLVEYACLRACDAVGLDVPAVDLAPDRTALLVERFDIDELGQRRGFEDACALSGIRRTGKYNGAVEHLFDMIRNFVPPDAQPAERLALLKLLLMNDVLRNGDAHLKNFGLLYDDVARPRLAPVFDVLTTPVWIRNDQPALALRKSDQEHCPWMGPKELQALAELADLPTVDVEGMHRRCGEIALDSLLDTFDDCPDSPERKALELAIEIVESGLGTEGRPRPRLCSPSEPAPRG
jgi:serine/threonine-protein kinase HipA